MPSIWSQFSLWTIVLIGIVCCLTIFFHVYRYNHRTVEVAPNILTSIGIFGTFLGVAIGLWQFNAGDIQNSVPHLMDGLRTAFWSSIAGLLGALTIKLRHALGQAKVQARAELATINDLDTSLQQLVAALDADQDKNFISLLKDNHTKTLEGMQQVLDKLDHYQERMAEANAKALVDAIEMVMKDFNAKINEQYGDNFKRLNESVISMLEWQKSYKQQLLELIDEQERTSKSMQEASQAFEYMVKHANAFNGISESLQELLTGLETQRLNLHSQLGSLADLVNHAGEGLPNLEGRILALTQGVADAVAQQQRWLSEQLVQAQENIQQQLQQTLGDSAKQLEAQQQESTEYQQRMSERLERQIVALDEGMEEELNKALKSFGMQLTALSEKFVADYTPLTKRLQTLIKMAEKS